MIEFSNFEKKTSITFKDKNLKLKPKSGVFTEPFSGYIKIENLIAQNEFLNFNYMPDDQKIYIRIG